jgi:hypothetical protein
MGAQLLRELFLVMSVLDTIFAVFGTIGRA